MVVPVLGMGEGGVADGVIPTNTGGLSNLFGSGVEGSAGSPEGNAEGGAGGSGFGGAGGIGDGGEGGQGGNAGTSNGGSGGPGGLGGPGAGIGGLVAKEEQVMDMLETHVGEAGRKCG